MIKKTIIGVCILVSLVLLFPFRGHLKDGGSVEYRAALYCVTDVHSLTGNTDPEHEYIDGIIVEILGIEVFNNTEKAPDDSGLNDEPTLFDSIDDDSAKLCDPIPVDYFCTANVTPEKINIKSDFGHEYSSDGTVIQEDTGVNGDKVQELLQKRIEEDNICPAAAPDLTLRFTDKVPNAVKLYNHFYVTNDPFEFTDTYFQECLTVNDPDDTAEFHIGSSLGGIARSYTDLPRHYRIMRLVCEFDTETVEYYIISC